ncbi:hypothetical protein AV274_4565 [Blastocystis sp. ATCC 50177/Nand II]|uniref:Uncharacterized protein n=1 Tax=Blastocystis sp. subtype 1 (strain ATCC 50177 / NandII) TaxID=478820 RepID=A0A196SCA8_BLAHN|nr:hypothetical protein AV274_4565 [Blastocystis sp. ATCC 50177/Nand II]
MSGIADMWSRIMGKGAQEISLPLDDVYRKSDRRRVVIDGTQVSTIIAALVETGGIPTISTSLFVNGTAIPCNSSIETINSLNVHHKSYSFILDLLYILRFKVHITIEFSTDTSALEDDIPVHSHPELSIPQCILFLLPNYWNLCVLPASAIKACRPNVVRNHYITLQQLNGLNPGLDLSSVLRATDPEHLLVAERALFHAIKSLVRVPVFTPDKIGLLYDAHRRFSPTVENLRYILKAIPAPLYPSLVLVFRFYERVFHLTHAFPSNEVLPLLCATPDPLFFSTLALTLPSLLFDHRQLWLASVLIHRLAARRWHVALNRAASLLVLLQELTTTKAVDAFLQANGSLSDSDVLSAALLLLEPGRDGLFDEWVLQVARYVWCETANYKELVQLHTLVNLLTTEQRCCLFWVTQLLALQADAAALTRVFASKLGGSYNGECIASILWCLVKNCAFAFFPSIPRLTQAVAAQSAVGLLPDDQTLFSFPAFSMRARFADLHEQARAEQTATTDLASLMEFYACPETFSEPRISIHENAEWSAAWMRVVQAHR